MHLKSLNIRNFFSIRKAAIDFSRFKGLTVVEGPNGAGKTCAFIEAPAWLLTGQTVRKIPVADVQREQTKDAVMLSGIVELDDGRELMIERTRPGGLSFSIVGEYKVRGTTQADLDQLLGITYKLFTTSVVFGGAGVSSFCGLPDVDRKKILERMLDTQRYIDAGARAKDELQEIQKDYNENVSRQRFFSSRIVTVKSDIEKLTESAQMFSAEQKSARVKAEKEIEALKALLASHKEKLNSLRATRRTAKKKYVRALAVWTARQSVAAASAKRARELAAEALADLRGATVEIEYAQGEVDRLTKDVLPEVCPECGTPRDRWPDPKRRAVSTEAPYKRLEKAHVVHKKAKRALEITRENLDACDRAASTEASRQPEKPGNKKIDDQKNVVARTHDRIKTAEDNLRNAQKARKNPFTPLIRARVRELSKLEHKETVFGAREKRIGYDAALTQFWSKHFRNLAAMTLDEAAPFLSKRACVYAETLTNGVMSITFDPSEQSRGKTFLPIVTNADGGNSYEKSSLGEKARIDLCVLLALRDLMESRLAGKFSQIFLDEVFDGLDEEGIECATATLRKVFRNKSVFLITHNPALKNAADTIVSVQKRQKQTVLTIEK